MQLLGYRILTLLPLQGMEFFRDLALNIPITRLLGFLVAILWP
ncbi:hypothetical protein OSCI_4030021 [Kamptonema sp. PCC 6506]|nr:hypothetical protein OSCI_4030021 [Kamptonema sp. PCC 6506]